jgi:putative addiction module component (TIGR02574 family)
MPLSLDQLAQEALQLPAVSRAQLAEKLVASLSNAEADEIQRAWAAQALRRRDEVRSGKVQTIDGDSVISKVRSAIGR